VSFKDYLGGTELGHLDATGLAMCIHIHRDQGDLDHRNQELLALIALFEKISNFDERHRFRVRFSGTRHKPAPTRAADAGELA
jgi:hypothetical protein